MSYRSPIDIIYGDMVTNLQRDVLKVIQSYDITVDMDELLKALTYDRDQYNKGWFDGFVQANEGILRCKDCRCHGTCLYEQHLGLDGYCSKAERKDEEDL